jgi:acyl-CoA reductase-like NAD-dependent aldehyde dehydrogenase
MAVEMVNQVLPPGALNAVPGIAAGPALPCHPRVERITFTGATATGQPVLRSAAENHQQLSTSYSPRAR